MLLVISSRLMISFGAINLSNFESNCLIELRTFSKIRTWRRNNKPATARIFSTSDTRHFWHETARIRLAGGCALFRFMCGPKRPARPNACSLSNANRKTQVSCSTLACSRTLGRQAIVRANLEPTQQLIVWYIHILASL